MSEVHTQAHAIPKLTHISQTIHGASSHPLSLTLDHSTATHKQQTERMKVRTRERERKGRLFIQNANKKKVGHKEKRKLSLMKLGHIMTFFSSHAESTPCYTTAALRLVQM